jgi:NitT/TauT family transport system substrate-binding protein
MTTTRRHFLTTLALGSAGLSGAPVLLAAEGPPETTTVRFAKIPAICFAPQYVCDELLRAEGFKDIQYVDADFGVLSEDLGHGRFDFASSFAPQHIVAVDTGAPICILTGVHVGCVELFSRDGLRGITI